MGKDFVDIEAVDWSHCLRPEFTAGIIHSLINRRISLNLIGAKGTGKSRLCEDICRCRLAGVRVVYVDLKSYVNAYGGLLREIRQQLKVEGEMPARVGRLFERLERRKTRHVLLLDNYDALLDNPKMDGAYDVEFFDDLNAIKSKDNVSLLCTSRCAHNTLPVFIDRQSYRNSWLTLEKEHLPALTKVQVTVELKRQVNESHRQWLENTPDDRDKLTATILKHPMPYALLGTLARQIDLQDEQEWNLKFKRRLKRWLKTFNRDNRPGLNKKIHLFRQKVDGKRIAFGDPKPKIPIFSFLSSLIKKKMGIE
jgi:hypothetical protein